MIASRTACGLCNNLEQKKIEQKIRGEMESLNFPSILSKIVVVLMIYDIIVFETSVFDHPHVNKRSAILKISSCYPKKPWTEAKTTKQPAILRIPGYVCPDGA